jgi:heat shock protein HslJ
MTRTVPMLVPMTLILSVALVATACATPPAPSGAVSSPAAPSPVSSPVASPVASAASEGPITSDLQGIAWQWLNVTDRTTGQVTTVPTPASYTITFHADGSVSGQADCNSFSGTWSQGDGVTITLTTTTMAFCGEQSMDQQYTQLLSSVAAGGPDGAGGLALETAGGAQRMLFQDGGAAAAP